MCRMFEKVSGRKTNGNKDKLEGMLKFAVDSGRNAVIMSIPVEMLEIDTSYQTEERTARDLGYLVKNWDDNKCLPLSGVPHWEEGKIYLYDGYGRWIGSQLLKEPKKELEVMIILNAPEGKEERRLYEAEMYAFQNRNVARMTPLQKHGAMLLMHDKATETLESMKKKYGFTYKATKGKREPSVLGSYSYTLEVCKTDDGKAAEYVFDVCVGAGFDRKANGYARYIMKSLRDIYKLYANDREKTKKFLIKELRRLAPIELRARAIVKYPTLEIETATSLYLEDLIVENLGLEQSRKVEGTKLVAIEKKTA